MFHFCLARSYIESFIISYLTNTISQITIIGGSNLDYLYDFIARDAWPDFTKLIRMLQGTTYVGVHYSLIQ